ncbi:MAG: glycoside hydrolase family 36 protein [Myxococcota bacterium]|nr:glycoside hydrolase family 36 protein [Myxococcota bacterium]
MFSRTLTKLGPMLLWAIAFAGCSDDEPEICAPASFAFTETKLVLSSPCLKVDLRFEGQVQVDQEWKTGQCAVTNQEMKCSFEDAGVYTLKLNEGALTSSFESSAQITLRGLRIRGQGALPNANAWLSNGFQSWSQSGVIQIGRQPTQNAINKALRLEGDPEVLREGTELSWWYSFIGSSTGPSVVAGVTSVDRWRSWVSVYGAAGTEQDIIVELNHGGADETLSLQAGDIVDGEPWFVQATAELNTSLKTYAQKVNHRKHSADTQPALGWNSWYDLWDKVSSEDIVANASIAATMLGNWVPNYESELTMVIDDGWQKAWGEWFPNDKFSQGMESLAQDIAQEGWRPGIWLAPLLVDPKSDLAAEHPDWLVMGAAFLHPIHGNLRVLDVTNPEAAEHLKTTIQRIVGWGYRMLKIDFLFAGTFVGGRKVDNVLGLEAYKTALSIIRSAAGEQTELLAVGAPGIPSVRYVDAWRVGPDIAFEQTGVNWHFIPGQARNIAARWPVCTITYCDGDPALLRGLPESEVKVGAWVAALAGGAFFLSDNLPKLEESRKNMDLDPKIFGLGLSGSPAVPVDNFPKVPPTQLTSIVDDIYNQKTTHVVPQRWQLPSGETILLNLTENEVSVAEQNVPARMVVVGGE